MPMLCSILKKTTTFKQLVAVRLLLADALSRTSKNQNEANNMLQNECMIVKRLLFTCVSYHAHIHAYVSLPQP